MTASVFAHKTSEIFGNLVPRGYYVKSKAIPHKEGKDFLCVNLDRSICLQILNISSVKSIFE